MKVNFPKLCVGERSLQCDLNSWNFVLVSLVCYFVAQ